MSETTNSYKDYYTIEEWNKRLKYLGGKQESSEYGIPVGAEIEEENREKVEEVLSNDYKENLSA